MLNLTMVNYHYQNESTTSSSSSSTITPLDFESISEELQVMRRQEETHYKCTCEYMRNNNNDPKRKRMDESYREKMCEWSYRVIDHFHLNREVIAVSFNYLDRFLDVCICDKTTLKLAAITSLYIACKVYGTKELPLSVIVGLCRGEFFEEHITEMETIILHSLSWRMHPPSAVSFISYLCKLFPSTLDPSISHAILQRASFFAELAAFDYYFAKEKSSSIALSALVNAMEGFDTNDIPVSTRTDFLRAVSSVAGLSYDNSIAMAQKRLWKLYSRSKQFTLDDADLTYSDDDDAVIFVKKQRGSGSSNRSPVSVCRLDSF